MIKLVLSIRSLNIGGSERQFIELIKNIDKTKFDISVCTMYGGEQEDLVKQIPNIKYFNLQKTGRYDFYQFYNNYTRLLKEIDPDIIYSFLGEMNLFSLWCKPKETKVIWGFRSSNMVLAQYGKVPQFIFWLQKKLSSKIDKIIANSHASIEFHKTEGFDMRRSVVVANGIDTNKFHRNIQMRQEFREKYHLKESDVAIAIVARIDYMKGYLIFAQAAKKLLEEHDDIYIFSIGGGDKKIKKECESILNGYNNTRFVWLGNRKDVENIYPGFDISCSSSFGEGFSNSIAESMSCEVPCVVTDVGDSALIIDKTGIVVQSNDLESLYTGLNEMIKNDSRTLGTKSRQRIVKHFSIEQMVKKTEKEIYELVE